MSEIQALIKTLAAMEARQGEYLDRLIRAYYSPELIRHETDRIFKSATPALDRMLRMAAVKSRTRRMRRR